MVLYLKINKLAIYTGLRLIITKNKKEVLILVDKRNRDYKISIRKIRQGKQERFGTNKKEVGRKKTEEEREAKEKSAEEEESKKESIDFLEDENVITVIGEELAKEFCENKGKIEKGHEIVVDFYRLGFVANVTVTEVTNRAGKLRMVCDINGKEILIDLSGYIKTLKKMQSCNFEKDCKNC